MKTEKLLIVEDEPGIRELLKLYLEKEGFQVSVATDGLQALQKFEADAPDLILLDIIMPGMDGFSVCREIRQVSNVPILFISCNNDSEDIVRGLEMGADDYIEKPFDPSIVVARVRANLRRAPLFRRQASHPDDKKDRHLSSGALHIDLTHCQVKLRGQELPLTIKEVHLLAFLVQHPDQVFTTQELYQHVWGADSAGDTRTVSVHISSLRKKLDSYADCIQNIRGIGYKYVD